MKKKTNKIEVKKIVIKIGDAELSLSLKEAQELRKVLGEVVGINKTEKEYMSYGPIIPQYPVYPFWQVDTRIAPERILITCDGTDSTATLTCNNEELNKMPITI